MVGSTTGDRHDATGMMHRTINHDQMTTCVGCIAELRNYVLIYF
jgi:hypothetical protein